MLIACIVIVYIVFLRYMYERKVRKEQQKSGLSATPSSPDFASLKKSLDDISARLAGLERGYRDSSLRPGGPRP